jgi:flagellar biosynthesis anti-sigma factor FlgM
MNNINPLQRALRSKQAAAAVEQPKNATVRGEVASRDQVSISTQAQDAMRLRAAVSAAPDIRADKVNTLREAIKQGTYHVSAKDIAAQMLGHQGDKE